MSADPERIIRISLQCEAADKCIGNVVIALSVAGAVAAAKQRSDKNGQGAMSSRRKTAIFTPGHKVEGRSWKVFHDNILHLLPMS